MPCSVVAMHHLPFAFKRAHRATLKLLSPIAARAGLTPARFDLLHLLHARPSMVEPFQCRIAKLLGLCRSTICKMLKAMEKIGLVQRARDMMVDQRYRRVTITRHGRWCIRRVLKAIRRREVEKPLLKSMSFWNCDTRNKRRDFSVDLAQRIRRLLIGLNDRMFLSNPYPVPMQVAFQKTWARVLTLAAAAPKSDAELADIIAQDLAETID